jgi:hypothetical protein
MRIFRLSDRIPARIGEVTFWLSPLSYEQRIQLLSAKRMEGGVEVDDNAMRARLAMKFAIKDVDGVTCADGSPYAPAKDADGTISLQAVDELASLPIADKAVAACFVSMRDPGSRQIEGVEFDLQGVKNVEKKD